VIDGCDATVHHGAMTTVGGDGKPLEDILNRLNDLSRAPREIDLREPPPVPSSPPISREPAINVETDQAADLAPPVVPSTAPAIDLTAPPVEPAAEPAVRQPESAPANEGDPRESSRVALSARVDHDSRYGRNGAVAPTVVRQAPTPHNVPVLPVSVKDDEPASVVEEVKRKRRWVLPVLFLVLLAVALAVVLAVL